MSCNVSIIQCNESVVGWFLAHAHHQLWDQAEQQGDPPPLLPYHVQEKEVSFIPGWLWVGSQTLGRFPAWGDSKARLWITLTRTQSWYTKSNSPRKSCIASNTSLKHLAGAPACKESLLLDNYKSLCSVHLGDSKARLWHTAAPSTLSNFVH